MIIYHQKIYEFRFTNHFYFTRVLLEILFRKIFTLNFWQTQLTKEGIIIKRLWLRDLKISWDEIEIIDLQNLEPKNYHLSLDDMPELKNHLKFKETFGSFRIQLKKDSMAKNAARMTCDKISYDAEKTISFQGIHKDYWVEIINDLKNISNQNNITMNYLYFDI
jgi:hypothetical protein